MRIATPVSTLIQKATRKELQTILSLTDTLEVRDHVSADLKSGLPRLYHCELSLVAPWDDAALSQAVSTIKAYDIVLTSFHVLSRYSEPGTVDRRFVPRGNPMSEEEMLVNARHNIESIRHTFPAMEFLVENNNYFRTGAYEIVTDAVFLRKLMEQVGVNLLLDIGHAEITARNRNISFETYITSLSLSRVRQIHLSGIARGKEEYDDAHEELTEKDWRNFEKISAQCPVLEFTSIEYYKDAQKLIAMLKKLRSYV